MDRKMVDNRDQEKREKRLETISQVWLKAGKWHDDDDSRLERRRGEREIRRVSAFVSSSISVSLFGRRKKEWENSSNNVCLSMHNPVIILWKHLLIVHSSHSLYVIHSLTTTSLPFVLSFTFTYAVREKEENHEEDAAHFTDDSFFVWL